MGGGWENQFKNLAGNSAEKNVVILKGKMFEHTFQLISFRRRGRGRGREKQRKRSLSDDLKTNYEPSLDKERNKNSFLDVNDFRLG